jgi:hypothetical protein
MDNKAYFESDWKGENISLYWDTIPRPIGIKKLPSGYWEIIVSGRRYKLTYPTQKLAKIALLQKVCWKLRDQAHKMYVLLDTLESEEKEREII